MLQRADKVIAPTPLIKPGQEPTDNTHYVPLVHDFMTHAINRLGKRTKVTITQADPLAKITDSASWQIASRQVKASICLENQEQVRAIFLKPHTKKLYNKIFELLAPKIPGNLDTMVALKDIQDLWPITFNISDFMAECDLKDRKHARQMLIEAGLALRELHWSFTLYYTNNKGQRVREDRDIKLANKVLTIEEPTLTNSTFTFSVDSSLVLHLARHGYTMLFDTRYYKIDSQKYPQAPALAMEIGYLANQQPLTNNGELILKATALLNACGGLVQLDDISSYKATDRHFTERIIEPIEKALDHLAEVGIIKTSWEWCSKGGKVKEPELINIKNINSLYIKIPLASEYPIAKHNEIRKQIVNTKKRRRKA